MKKFFLAIVAFLTVTATTAARAADGTQGQTYNWGGFYLGADIGYGWGEGDTKFTPLPSAAVFINLLPQTLNPDPRGVLGGAHVGYNWQGQGVVIGGEVDISGSDMRDSVKRSPITQNNGTPFPGGISSRTTEYGRFRYCSATLRYLADRPVAHLRHGRISLGTYKL